MKNYFIVFILLFWGNTYSQDAITVSGTVMETDSNPLPGVNILLKGTSRGTQTDFDGNYILEDVPDNAILVFSYIGYNSVEEEVGGRTKINVILRQDAQNLDEIVVVGYGTARKSDLTGSVASVSSEVLEGKTHISVDQALQGAASGVMATSVSGEPGAGMNIRIRGVSSFSNASEPLYVIDGVPVLVNGDYTFSSSSNPLASLNPSDIKSIEILKDASATSIYGSRGSNGVVLITTQRGGGQTKITLNTSYTTQSLIKKIDVAKGPELVSLIREFRSTLGWGEIFDGSDISYPTPANAKNYDYQDLIFRDAAIISTGISISGGKEDTQYFISGNFLDQEGIMIETGFKRYGFRANLDQRISEKFKLGTNTFFSHTVNNKPTTNVSSILQYPSFLPVYDENGDYLHNRVYAAVPATNPVAAAREQTVTEYVDRTMLSFNGEYQIFEDLKFNFRGSYDGSNQRVDNFITPKHIAGEANNGMGSVTNRKITNLIFSSFFTYDKKISDDLSLNATAGYELQNYQVEGSSLSGRDFGSTALGIWGLSSAGPDNRGVGTTKRKKNLVGYFGRINLNIKDRYLITANARADGSSVFADNNKWGFFPSVAVAWKLDQEDFMKNLDIFHPIKLRVSYGSTGNGEIPLYQSQALWNLNNNVGFNTGGVIQPAFGGNSASDLAGTAYLSRIANPDLKWERTTQFDVGIDVGMLDGALMITADYYKKKTVDAIIPRAIPKTSGFELAFMNIGSLLNEGVELAINAYPVSGDFSWNLGANVTFMKQMPLDLSDNEFLFVSAHGDGGRESQLGVRMELDKPSALLWGVVYDGVWNDEAEIRDRNTVTGGNVGDYRMVDINGDNVLDANDKTYVGRALPSMVFGFSNTFKYKNLSLDMVFQGSYGNDTQINYWTNLLGMQVEFPTNVSREYLNNYWTPNRTDGKYAGISGATSTTLREWETNNLGVFDASYIRMQSITLSYNLRLKEQNIFDAVKLYITGENLLTITNYPGYNPDVASLGFEAFNAGYDNGAYPISKRITLGLSVDF